MFEVLALTLEIQNVVGLVRYVRVSDSAPKLGILVPHIGRKLWMAWIQVLYFLHFTKMVLILF